MITNIYFGVHFDRRLLIYVDLFVFYFGLWNLHELAIIAEKLNNKNAINSGEAKKVKN